MSNESKEQIEQSEDIADDVAADAPSVEAGPAEMIESTETGSTETESTGSESIASESGETEPAELSSGETPAAEAPPSEQDEADDASADEFADDESASQQASDEEEAPKKPRSKAPSASDLAVEDDDPSEQEQKQWYILKVQSNRENSIAEALQRRIVMEGLEDSFGEVVVPTEMRTEFKGGKKRVVRTKLYPGYIVVHMVINDDTWFVVRETPGIGDFTGSGGKPTPMLQSEVDRIISTEEEKEDDAPKLNIKFAIGDRIKINDGTFDNFEGEVSDIAEATGRVTVMINIFGRPTPVELEYWQVETI